MSRCVHTRALLSLCALALLVGCSSTGRAARDAAKLVEARQLTLRGLDALQQEDWQTAENLFHDAVTASPHDERAHWQYAKTLWHRGERSESLQHMSEAVRLSGDAPELLVEFGRMQLAVGSVDAARRSAQQAIRGDPQYAAAHALIGDCLVQQGRLDQALESYHLALSLDARQPAVRLAVAKIYQTWEEPRRILSTLQDMPGLQSMDDIENGPAMPGELAGDLPPVLAGQTYLLRGMAERQLGRHRDAVHDLTQAARLIPTADVYYELASAQQESGDVDAAKLSLDAALAQNPAHQSSQKLLSELNTLPRLATQTLPNRK